MEEPYNMKIVATLSESVQVGENDFRQVRTSRVFSCNRSINEIISWARSQGIGCATINDVELSEYTGESL